VIAVALGAVSGATIFALLNAWLDGRKEWRLVRLASVLARDGAWYGYWYGHDLRRALGRARAGIYVDLLELERRGVVTSRPSAVGRTIYLDADRRLYQMVGAAPEPAVVTAPFADRRSWN
jgi:hypothetical protein